MSFSAKGLVDLFCEALELKEKKRDLYDKASSSCRDEVGKETFRFLRDEEAKCIEYLQELYEELKAGREWAEVCRMPPEGRAIDVLYKEMRAAKEASATGCSKEVEALDVGVQLEEAAIKLFEGRLEKAESSEEKEMLRNLSVEEREHRRILEDLKFYYTDPHAWFMEKSGARLDGAGAMT